MNTDTVKRFTAAALAGAFAILALSYIADPGRRRTRKRLVAESQLISHDNMLSSLNVTAIAEDSCGMVWIGTSAGINVYDGQTYTQFAHDARDSTALPDDYINTLHLDRQGRMWVGTQNGVALYAGAGRFRRFALPEADCNVTLIGDGRQTGEVIVGTTGHHRHGCYAVSPSGVSPMAAAMLPHPTPQPEIPGAPFSLRKPQQIVSCTFRDSKGNVWVGFRNAGYQVVSDRLTAFKRANANALATATEGKDVVSLGRVGHSLLAATTLRLYTYDQRRDRVAETYFSQLFDSVAGTRRELTGIVPLDGGRAWLVGNRQVLSCRVDGSTTAVDGRAFGAAGGKAQLGSATRVGDSLYVSSEGALLSFGYGSGAPHRTAVTNRWYDSETQLTTLADGRVLLFMRNMQLAVFSPHDGRLTPLATSGAAADGNTDPAFARQDSYGDVWLGTKRSGLYRLHLSTGRLERTAFLSDVHIQGMSEDGGRNLWFTTLKDVVCYNPRTGTATPDPLLSSSLNNWTRQYFDNAIGLTPDGRCVVFGSSDGCRFISVQPAGKAMAAATRQTHRPRIYSLAITTQDGRRLLLADDTRDGSAYTLAHDENTLSVRFFHPDYGKATAAMFQCRVDGYDHDWQPPTFRREATYANLPPGHYVLRLRMLTSHGRQAAGEQRVSITVRPAWWASGAAWLFYGSCVVALLFYLSSLYFRLRMGHLQLMQEQHEREREQRMREMNMSFFANISHEFRNPLTLIAGPLMSLRADTSLPRHVALSLNRVCMSVNRMLRLIDQMLDFNQLETDALRLRVARCDAAAELRRLASAFEESGRVRGIRVSAVAGDGCESVWMDADKFEKIVSNLFTNALKHTPDGGTIALALAVTTADGEGRTLRGSVENSGSHIPAERMADVFKRYYQLADTTGSHHYGWGTGIGLYYVRRLVTLHHGLIGVSNTEGGVVFSFAWPADDRYRPSEHDDQHKGVMQIPLLREAADGRDAQEDSGQKKEATNVEDRHTAEGAADDTADGRKTILVVDDDTDVAQYIRSIFEADYNVVNRYSAEDALADIAEVRPDIVLSDVIMGRMSGFEFCKRLKGDLMLSHIPVVMITAKANIDEQISGLRLGAVAYVTKPFDPAYLQAIVEAQLQSVHTLRRLLGASTTTESMPPGAADTLSEQDHRFMDELYALMELRSAELELNVSTVCRDLLISQSKFNYKLKQLTGDTPGTFFRKYKLNRAAQMLHEGKHTVAEVALLTGFGTAAHFSVAFKKQFGVVPSEYK